MSRDFFRSHRTLFFLNFFSVFVFSLTAFFVVETNSLTRLDAWAQGIYVLKTSDTVTSIMEAVSFLFHPGVLIIVALLGFSFFAGIGKKIIAGIFLVAMVGGVFSSFILKNIFEIARPIGDPLLWGFGFPSTHATAIAIFFLSSLLALDAKLKDKAVHILAVFVIFGLIFLTGVSRIYLGYHSATDVLAGFALGTFWVTLAFLVYYRIKQAHGYSTYS